MQQLRFTAVHEDGAHLVLTAAGSEEEYLVEIDERLRAAVRPRAAGRETGRVQAFSPRGIQAMIRAGETAAEVAESTGWPVERVARFEAPILAEREHVSRLARSAHVRGRGPDGALQTLQSRAHERLSARGVDVDVARWDSSRPEGGRWTIVLTFVAGARDRRAGWHYDTASHSVEALDDEARWLSEDEQTLPGGAAGHALLGGSGDGTGGGVDLMTTMRERSRARGRRRRSGTSEATGPSALPDADEVSDELLPLEELPYDPDTMGLPPSAHGHPRDDAPAVDASSGAEAASGAGSASEADGVNGEAGTGPGDEDTALAQDPTPADVAQEPDPGDDGSASEEDADEDSERTVEREPTLADFFGADEDDDADEDELSGVVAESGSPTESEPAGPVEGTGEREDPAAARRRGRTSVPSWDDIMFGAKDRR